MNPQRSLDLPMDGELVSLRTLRVAGWTVAADVARIEVLLDGELTLAEPFAAPRPDVLAVLPDCPDALMSGFDTTALVDQTQGRRDIALEVTEVSVGGQRTLIGSRTVTLTGASDDGRHSTVDADYVAALRVRVEQASARARQVARPVAGGLHVLVVTHDLGLGGGQLYLTELLSGLLARPGFGFTVVCQGDGPLRADLEAMGAAVHLAGPFVTTPAAYECMMRELVGLASEVGAGAILANTLGAFCGPDLASRMELPALWAIHESYPLDLYWINAHGPSGVDPYFESRARHSLASSAAVIFEAEATRQIFVGHGDSRRFVKVDYGIPTGAIDAYVGSADRATLRARNGFGEHQVVVLCMGTIEPRKSQAALLRAFARVAGGYQEAVLVLVGHRGDTYGQFISDYAGRLGLGDRVRIVPVNAESYDWYLMADAFALASSVESLPRSVLEAMAFGLPVVTTNVFGLGEVIVDGVNGLTFAPANPAAIAAGLDRLLAMTPDERGALGRRGQAVVHESHNSAGYVAAYEELLRGLANDASAYPADLLGGASPGWGKRS